MRTDNEIKKALECCTKEKPQCDECKYCVEDFFCNRKQFLKDLLDYFNRLQAENERLSDLLKQHQRHTNRIRLLTAETAKKIKAEARKEFAERLKENSNEIVIGGKYKYRVVTTEYIDNLLKELVGEKTPTNDVKCKECEYLMFSDCYGECSKAYKGIVSPDDSCGKGKRKEGKK